MIDINNVSYKYKNGNEVLKDINVKIKKRGICCYNR